MPVIALNEALERGAIVAKILAPWYVGTLQLFFQIDAVNIVHLANFIHKCEIHLKAAKNAYRSIIEIFLNNIKMLSAR